MTTSIESFTGAILVAAGVWAGTGILAAQTSRDPAPGQDETAVVSRIALTAGRSTVLTTEFDIVRIAVTNPEIADAVVVAPRELLIDGKAAGTISLIVWGADRRAQYDLAVAPPVTTLQQQLRELFPGEQIQVNANEKAITLSGRVSSNAVMLKAGEIAAKTAPEASLINLLDAPGGSSSQQVMLQVRFAEVNRQVVSQLGVTLFTGQSEQTIARLTTEQFAAPTFNADGTLTFSDLLNLFVFSTDYNVGALLKALQTQGVLQSLAEPNLIAYNGREASFLAGGEIPVPILQGGSAAGGVTVSYKEFGVRLTFTPTIAGDFIRLHVRPEVSSLDYANGVTLGGFRIPAVSIRRAETDVELRDGQSFAIAGLLDNSSQTDRSAIPLLGSLPIIGHLFKSKALRKQRTELMVLITPHLVAPLEPGEVPELPTDSRQFLPPAEGVGDKLRGGGGTVDGPGVTGGSDPAPTSTPKPKARIPGKVKQP